MTLTAADTPSDFSEALRAFALRYCWDGDPNDAERQATRVILRTMDFGTWDDLLTLEQVAGPARLAKALSEATLGSLRPQSWSFWHVRLGLLTPNGNPPPMPSRRFA